MVTKQCCLFWKSREIKMYNLEMRKLATEEKAGHTHACALAPAGLNLAVLLRERAKKTN